MGDRLYSGSSHVWSTSRPRRPVLLEGGMDEGGREGREGDGRRVGERGMKGGRRVGEGGRESGGREGE